MNRKVRIILFALVIVAYPLANNLAEIVPNNVVAGYEDDPYSYYFWIGKALSVLLILAAWQLSNGLLDQLIFRVGYIGIWLLAFLEFFLVIPTPSGQSYGWPGYIVLTIMFGVPLLLLGYLVISWLKQGSYERMIEQNEVLEQQLRNKEASLSEIRTTSLKKIAWLNARMVAVINTCETKEDLASFNSIIQKNSDDLFEELVTIKKKTLN